MMTDPAHPACFGDSSQGPLESFAALRLAHVELRRKFSEISLHSSDSSPLSDQIRLFVERISKTGEILIDERERLGAQAILDYWRNELIAAGELSRGDYTIMLLAKPASISPSLPGLPSTVGPKDFNRPRDVIRFVSGARLWKDQGRKNGYLLFGQAIEDAARYRREDPDIEDWVAASEAERAGTKKRYRIIAATLVAVLFIGIIILKVALPVLETQLIHWMKNASSNVQRNNLWLLGKIQFLRPPYDLSTVIKSEKVSLPGLRLHAPNFSKAVFRDVNFEGGNFKNISLSESFLQSSNFEGAVLDFAVFRAAKVDSSSFSRAQLYRAVFDRACLVDVNFSSADLRLSSFWGAKVGANSKDFKQLFENSGWWHATGWNSRLIDALLASDQSKISESAGYNNAMKEAREYFSMYERANSLNNLAWIRATWGMVQGKSAPLESGAPSAVGRSCATIEDSAAVPESALDTADQALCIASAAKRDNDIANFSDTKAYILMQTPGRMQEAANMYAAMKSADGSLFRWAVAQYAVGDHNGALKNLERSTTVQRYLPTHELHTLREYIKDEFKAQLYKFIDEVFPDPTRSPCDTAPDSVNPPPLDGR